MFEKQGFMFWHIVVYGIGTTEHNKTKKIINNLN
jgi:hypothetical protein